MKFKVIVTEILETTITVKADSPETAERIAEEQWLNADFVLGAEEFTGVTFKAVADDE